MAAGVDNLVPQAGSLLLDGVPQASPGRRLLSSGVQRDTIADCRVQITGRELCIEQERRRLSRFTVAVAGGDQFDRNQIATPFYSNCFSASRRDLST